MAFGCELFKRFSFAVIHCSNELKLLFSVYFFLCLLYVKNVHKIMFPICISIIHIIYIFPLHSIRVVKRFHPNESVVSGKGAFCCCLFSSPRKTV